MIAAAVLVLVVTALVQAVTAGHGQTADALVQEQAVSLAEALLEEATTRPYADPDDDTTPGPDTGETTRADFDALDDWHGFSEPPGGVADLSGALYPDALQAYARAMTAAYGSVSVSALGGTIPGITLTVTVTDSAGRTFTIERFVPEPAS